MRMDINQETDIRKLNVKELKELLKERGLSIKGKKEVLVKRLLNTCEKASNATNEITKKSKHLNIEDFNLYVNEYEAFKEFIFKKVSVITETLSDFKSAELTKIESLQAENRFLRDELNAKQTIIDILVSETEKLTRTVENQSQWRKVDREKKKEQTPTYDVIQTQNTPVIDVIETQNRFNALNIEPCTDVLVNGVVPRGNRRSFSKNKNQNNDNLLTTNENLQK